MDDETRISPATSPRSVLAIHPVIDRPTTAQAAAKPAVPSLRERFDAAGIGFMLTDGASAGGVATDRPSSCSVRSFVAASFMRQGEGCSARRQPSPPASRRGAREPPAAEDSETANALPGAVYMPRLSTQRSFTRRASNTSAR
jgi:hypothetical protein